MNKKFVAIACLAVAVAISPSCKKDFLNESDPNAITVDASYKTPNDVLLAVNGIYQSLRSGNNVGESSDLWTDQRSDDTGTQDNQSNAGEPFQFGNFSILPSNTYLKSHWVSLYGTVTRANVVLSHIDAVPFPDNSVKLQYMAEAKFLRAFTYFELVRLWGDVPLVTKQLSYAELPTATFREKQAVVYQQIVADLTDVINNSPLPNLQASTGRTSKAAANFLLGQVYLTMATTQDQANRTTNLTNAKTYLMNAYNMRTFGTLNSIPYTDVFDVAKKTTCPELIFQIVNIQGDVNYSSSIAANFQAKGETINSQKKSSGAGYNVTHDLINEYETNDPRMTFSVKYANDPIVKDWFVTKFRDVSTSAGVNGYGGNDWILMRYADVILSLAEVNNYLGDQAAAIGFLDQVRTRAGMPTYAASMTNSDYAAKYPTLKLAILHERRVELAFEHHRWYDLLRTFNDADLVAYFKAKKQTDFGLASLANFTTKDRYYPIPFDEYKLDPVKMYQNPGY
ncbi:RagB/SusD family nutrient uptake outer membrane protein [Mucilaginibacter rubeus]|uniref:RagB/SusD family nutrient uptake outer membrane protein n=1 Tax=Mucilaginibacter rubeus TaxID=2027860 RepID=A0AAE6MIZ0_9SPHI|nr:MULTISPECIES: RagB/SusD family nutrient uptake outer membrane protein [Mucilaginibacter]QEM05133.1 RagB/SusD family nutrient uptake outer membrane protein [Mucilaginibacter rubeus]QEM17725.1 RagB/SusD family nutrient uptake outer membrane protein [Mucilaginibacter gossypii]QTE45748.1 RagB/SusD family nutrient uptake outer membrane protein [Mucilaginibacter rubeus]QTE52345.1 RagB/SusD family nutrient uptake outer membrane protein [Mucilaginibacter rubeus]QTE57434.1 RagB/SusD family nutrient 